MSLKAPYRLGIFVEVLRKLHENFGKVLGQLQKNFNTKKFDVISSEILNKFFEILEITIENL